VALQYLKGAVGFVMGQTGQSLEQVFTMRLDHFIFTLDCLLICEETKAEGLKRAIASARRREPIIEKPRISKKKIVSGEDLIKALHKAGLRVK